MIRRVWTPCKNSSESTIQIFDSGAYWTEIDGDSLQTWEVLSREINSAGEIVEILKPMPQDWIPFSFNHTETFSLGRDWTIQTEIIQEEISHQPNLGVGAPQLQAQRTARGAEREPKQQHHLRPQGPEGPVSPQQPLRQKVSQRLPSQASPPSQKNTVQATRTSSSQQPQERKYSKQSAAHPGQTWTPLVHIVQQVQPSLKQPIQVLPAIPSSPKGSSPSPSQNTIQQSSVPRRNQASRHQHPNNKQKHGRSSLSKVPPPQ